MTSRMTARAVLDLTAFTGDWINTNEGPREIDRVSLRTADDRLYLRVRGNAHPGGADWGEIEVQDTYADPANSSQAVSFVAKYELELLRVELGVNLNQGLLVMAMFNSWHDNDSVGKNYFAREFFRQ